MIYRSRIIKAPVDDPITDLHIGLFNKSHETDHDTQAAIFLISLDNSIYEHVRCRTIAPSHIAGLCGQSWPPPGASSVPITTNAQLKCHV